MFAIYDQLVRAHAEQLIRDAHQARVAVMAAKAAKAARTSLAQRVVRQAA